MIALSIGAAGASAQRGGSAVDPIQLPADSRRLATELRGCFDPSRTDRWQAGFALVDVLGSAATGVLRELVHQNDPDIRVRMLLLAALGIVGGEEADSELLAVLTRRDAGDRERFLAAFALACGGPRETPAPELDRLLGRPGLEAPLLEASMLLAAWRFGRAVEPAGLDRLVDQKEPALAAAARLLRPPGVFKEERREHPTLVQRAEFLGSPPRALLLEDVARLRAIFADPDPATMPLRLCAADWLARALDPRSAQAALKTLPADQEALSILAASPGWREVLGDRLRAPSDLVDPSWRGRVALAFVSSASPAALSTASWGRDPTTLAAACLGLAWRLGHANAHDVPEWCSSLPDHPAREWIFVACGRAPRTRGRAIGIPSLDLLLSGFDDARLLAIERTTILDLTEDALVELGAHPACGRRQLELELIRDLLIAGSYRVAPVLGLPDDQRVRYLPRGLAPSDNAFDIAYEHWKFLSSRCRLPRAAARLR